MKVFVRISLLPIVLALLALSQVSCASEFKLVRPELMKKFSTIAVKSAESNKLAKVVIFENQMFNLKQGRRVIGTIVSGRGTGNVDGRDNSTCFVAFIKSNGQENFIKTVGYGNWEAEACISVLSIGIIHENGRKTPSFAIVYEAASPNTSVHEPVIFHLSEAKFDVMIDDTSTKSASLKGATTIKAIRKVLK